MAEAQTFTLDETFETEETNNITAFNVDKVLYLMIQKGSSQIFIKKVVISEDNSECTLEALHEFNDLEIEGKMHSVVSYDLNDHCLLFDAKNCFIIKIDPHYVKTIENVYVMETLMDTKEKATLFLASEFSSAGEGLHYLDLSSTLKKENLTSVTVVDLETGSYPSIDWVLEESRLGFIRSLTTLIITPIPYNNMNELYSAAYSHDYTLYRTYGLKHYIYIDKDHEMKTFDVVSGKEIASKIIEFDLNGFTRYNVRGYATTLYMSDEPVTDGAKVEDFF